MVEKKKMQRKAPRPPLKILEASNESSTSDAPASVTAVATVTASTSKQASVSHNRSKPKLAAAGKFEFISKSRSRQKQTRIAEALRGEGFDESALGRAYVKLVRKLFAGKKASGNDKLLVDVLKEISRTLEPPNPGSGASSPSTADGPMIVQLLHDVPRPVRDAPGDTPGDNRNDAQYRRQGDETFDHRQAT